jgi:hypothetical protein
MKYPVEVYRAAYLEAAQGCGTSPYPAREIARLLGISREYAYQLRARYGDIPIWETRRVLTPMPSDAEKYERVSHVIEGIFGPLPQTEAVIAAADRGTRIHTIVEDIISGFEPEGEEDEIAVARSAVDALLAMAGDHQLLIEVPVWSHRLQVRGRADAIIIRPYPRGYSGPDAEFAVVDVKTGQPSMRHHLQQGGYAACLLDMAREQGFRVDVRGYLLYVDRDGKAKVRPTASPADRAAFDAAVSLHRWVEVKR